MIYDLMLLVGGALVAHGAYLAGPPVAFMAGGVILSAAAALLAWRAEMNERKPD